jgi:hypothetical protein
MTTLPRLIAAGLVVLALGLTFRPAGAQEFRVFTVVYDLSKQAEGERPPVVARAATLFHAGKVYDFLDSANEVTVYEPTKQQFRVLHPSQRIVTTIAFDEIRTLLKIPRQETERQAERLEGSSEPEAAQAANLLRFQLGPRFEESFDEQTGLLTLDGGVLRYDVRTVDPARPEVVEAYLEYADWAHRLNYLLHPGLVLPEPRLALNQALRVKGRLPEAVEQRVTTTPVLRLRAEHTLNFQLNAQDRALIHQWETLLNAESTRQVPRQEYQKATLTAKAR